VEKKKQIVRQNEKYWKHAIGLAKRQTPWKKGAKIRKSSLKIFDISSAAIGSTNLNESVFAP
jgi:hypothetical protein